MGRAGDWRQHFEVGPGGDSGLRRLPGACLGHMPPAACETAVQPAWAMSGGGQLGAQMVDPASLHARSHSGSLGFGSVSFDELLSELLLPDQQPPEVFQLEQALQQHPADGVPLQMPPPLLQQQQQQPRDSPDSSSVSIDSAGRPHTQRMSPDSRHQADACSPQDATPFAVQNPMLRARLAQRHDSPFMQPQGPQRQGLLLQQQQQHLAHLVALHSRGSTAGSGALSEASVATHASHVSAPAAAASDTGLPASEPLLDSEQQAAALHRRSASYSQVPLLV